MPEPAVLHWPRLPWKSRRDTVATLGIYGVARVVSLLIFLATAKHQDTPHPGWGLSSQPDYWAFVGRQWDANWYYLIASSGYPQELPLDEMGRISENAWAFYPLFPFIAAGPMRLGVPWQVAAPTLSLIFGAIAMILIYQVVSRTVGTGINGPCGIDVDDVREDGGERSDRARWIALGTVALTAFFPSSPILQTGYTESLALCLIAAALLLLTQRRYWWCLVPVVALGFTRAVALPLACVVAVHLYIRWRRSMNPLIGDPLHRGEWVGILTLGSVSVMSGFVWQAIMAIVTKEPNAYVETQYAWRWFDTIVPGMSWVQMATFIMGWPGLLVLAALIGVAVWSLVTRRSNAIAPELRAWAGFYILYLIGVAEPQTSMARFVLLAFPFGAILLSWSRSRAYLAALVVCSVLLQVAWVVMLWMLNSSAGYPP